MQQKTTCLSSLALIAFLVSCQSPSFADLSLELQRVASGLTEPLYATFAPGAANANDLYFLQRTDASGDGRVRKLNLTTMAVTDVVTIPNMPLSTDPGGGEQGLLGLAFHPNFANSGQTGEGKFYVNHVDNTTDPGDGTYSTKVVEYDMGNLGSPTDVISYKRGLANGVVGRNHNGGWMDFGTDGYLYISSGDGGPGGFDQSRSGQDTSTLLGAMLRIDVNGDDFPMDADRNYAIPPTNPFAIPGGPVENDGAHEICAYGLRNPWRNSFDSMTGDFYIADVGQKRHEELNVMPADQLCSSPNGEVSNYGWVWKEGTFDVVAGIPPGPGDLIDPVFEYDHFAQTNAITGGYVYRGSALPDIYGRYLFADYPSGRIYTVQWDGTDPTYPDGTSFTNLGEFMVTTNTGTVNFAASFGQDASGEIYIVDIGEFSMAGTGFVPGTGEIYKVVGATVPEPSAWMFCLGAALLVAVSRIASYWKAARSEVAPQAA